MFNSEIVTRIMFDYDTLSDRTIKELASALSKKLLRWIAVNHPDNKTRILFYRLTNVRIGEGTVINRNLVISDDFEALVSIGNRVAISPNVTIIASSGPNNSILNQFPSLIGTLIRSLPVVIEDDAWIGADTTILPGVTIGARSVVGAGAVVAQDLPPDSLAYGVPAKAIRKIAD